MVSWDSQPLDAWAEKHAAGEFLRYEGVTTHYVKRGEGPALILLHGFFFDHNLWCRNIDILARDFTVYAMDFSGFGYSSRSLIHFTYETYAHQLLMFMTSLGIASASIVGQSLGAGVGIYFAVKYPQMLEKLILVGASGLPNPPTPGARFMGLPGVGEVLLKLPVKSLRKKMLNDVFVYRAEMITNDLFDVLTMHHRISGTVAAMLSIMRAEVVDKLENEIAELANLSLPSLLIWGRQDKAIPLSLGQELQRRLPASEMHVIDNAGHVPNLEQSGEFNAVIAEFLLRA